MHLINKKISENYKSKSDFSIGVVWRRWLADTSILAQMFIAAFANTLLAAAAVD